MTSPLFANGLTDISKLVPPGVTIQLSMDMGKSDFYLTSRKGTKGVFKIENIQLTAGWELYDSSIDKFPVIGYHHLVFTN